MLFIYAHMPDTIIQRGLQLRQDTVEQLKVKGFAQ